MYILNACGRDVSKEKRRQPMSFKSGTRRFSRHILSTVTRRVSGRLVSPRLPPWFHIYIFKISQTGSGRPPINTTLSLSLWEAFIFHKDDVSGFDARVAAFSLSLLQAFIKVDCCASRTSLKARLPFLCSSSSKLLFALACPKTPNANICFCSLLTCADADIFLWCISEGPLYIALALSYELLNTLYT